MTFALPQLPEAGSTLKGATFALGMGGKGSNQAVAARRLGAEVALWTAVGEDDFGRMGAALWDHEGVRATHVKRTKTPTMVGAILLEPDGENRIVVADGALLDLCPDDLGDFGNEVDNADVCLVSLEIPEAAAAAVLGRAREAETMTILNPAPASDLPDSMLSLADYLTPNYSEACRLAGTTGEQTAEDVCRRLRERYEGVIVMTLGADGVLIDNGRTTTSVPASPPQQIVDTTGAGDAFSAAFAVAIAEGFDVVEAATAGAAAGAHAVSVLGVIPALPRRRDLAALSSSAYGST
jgi:ribokinase